MSCRFWYRKCYKFNLCCKHHIKKAAFRAAFCFLVSFDFGEVFPSPPTIEKLEGETALAACIGKDHLPMADGLLDL